MSKKLLKTVAVASLVGLSSVNLLGCKEKVEEVKIIKEQEVEQKETIKIDDMEVTMPPLQPSLQLELPTEPQRKIEEETISQFEKTQEEIEEERIGNENEQKEIEKMNTQPTTGTDKNGHPYLQPGAQYTFGADGLPMEAPPKGKQTDCIIKDGITYLYDGIWDNKWIIDDTTDKEIARMEAIRDGKMDSQGNTNLITMSDEDKAQIAAGIARAMGD